MQLQALPLTEGEGDGDCSQPNYGHEGEAVAWYWNQHTRSEGTLIVRQHVEDVLTSTRTNHVNFMMMERTF